MAARLYGREDIYTRQHSYMARAQRSTEAQLYGRAASSTPRHANERTNDPAPVLSLAVVGGMIRGDRSFVAKLIWRTRGGREAFRVSLPLCHVTPLRSRERSLDLRRFRRSHVRLVDANARLARTLRLDERRGIEVTTALACSMPRANGANLDPVRIENPRNVLHVSRKRRAKERTNELATALAPGLAVKRLGKVVWRDRGVSLVRHAPIVSRTNERTQVIGTNPNRYRTFDKTSTTNIRQNLDNERSTKPRHGRPPRGIPLRDLCANRHESGVDCTRFLAFGASAS